MTTEFTFSETQMETLREKAREAHLSVPDYLRRAIGLYSYFHKETYGNSDRYIAIVDKDNKILQQIDFWK